MLNTLEQFLKEKKFAVVGATNRTDKYGYRIYKYLKNIGKTVYPVHVAIKELEGDKVYKTLNDLPEKVDVVDIVVPPSVTEKIVQECLSLGINKVWIQPGAESDKAINFCKDNNIELVYNACVMLGPNQ